jgi:S1-C subfamily serine protease
MNFLDFAIILMSVLFLAIHANRSAVYYSIGSLAAGGGLILALCLAPLAAHPLHASTAKAVVALVLMTGLPTGAWLATRPLAKKAKMQAVESWYRLDHLLVWPCKILAVGAGIVLLANSLVYVPALSLQFLAQGSTLLAMSNRIFAVPPIEKLASRIEPGQFHNLRLRYDELPPSAKGVIYTEVADPAATRQWAESVVKISGRGCVGLGYGSGFVAAPHFVVTNAHVVSGNSSIYISDRKGSYPATPVLIDKDYDIAVLYAKFLDAKPLRFTATPAATGSTALAYGYPAGAVLQIAEGRVINKTFSSSHGRLDGTSTLTLNTVLTEGASGGPILNESGKVVGVNDARTGSKLIGVRAAVAQNLVKKAQRMPLPVKTGLCDVPPKFY